MQVTELTRQLTAPPPCPVADGPRLRIREQLVSGVGPIVDRLPPGDQVQVTLPLLRQARTCPELLARPEEAFAWRPLFVRRSLGLAIVESCVTGRFRNPVEAAGPVAAEAVAVWERTGWRTFHWEPWFAGLAGGARATVLAEAVSWATSLWTALDWRALTSLPQVGGVDDQWSCPASRAVRVRGRSELRVALDADHTWGADREGARRGRRPDALGRLHRPVALVSTSGGRPGPSWAEELAFLALSAGLRSPSRPVPARVLGLWPDAGVHGTVEIDADILSAAADRVVSTVGLVVDARLSLAGPEAGRPADRLVS
jgi:hypothetical protein